MSTKLQQKDIIFCSSCAKPIEGGHYTVKNKLHGKEKWHYHNSIEECANAPAIKKDWRRIDKRGQTEAYHRAQAGLQASDGYSWDTDNSVPMR